MIEDPAVTRYVKDVRRLQKRKGDSATLVEQNLMLAVKMALIYQRASVSLIDLVQEANLGLLKAAEKFDPEKGKFSTYACLWIKSYLQLAVIRQGGVVARPLRAGRLNFLRNKEGAVPLYDESLDVETSTGRSLMDALKSDEPLPDGALIRAQDWAHVRDVVDNLDLRPLQKDVLESILMGDESQSVVAARRGCSRQNINKSEKLLVSRLKKDLKEFSPVDCGCGWSGRWRDMQLMPNGIEAAMGLLWRNCPSCGSTLTLCAKCGSRSCDLEDCKKERSASCRR